MNYADTKDLKIIVKKALSEDIGFGDITTKLFIPKESKGKAVILAKEELIVCGVPVAETVFKQVDKNISFSALIKEGTTAKRNDFIAKISGKTRSILSAERVALNFLGLLSGIATKTRDFVEAIQPYKTKILDTRKTIPGLRFLEKYAVRIGGGYNHRMSLDEMVMIKDNHIEVTRSPLRLRSGQAGHKVTSLKNILKQNRNKIPKGMKIEIEVENLKQFKEVLNEMPDIIMLDNMSVSQIKEAVRLRNNLSGNYKPLLEASGGITLVNVKNYASTGVDMISVGALTHSIDSADVSLEIL